MATVDAGALSASLRVRAISIFKDPMFVLALSLSPKEPMLRAPIVKTAAGRSHENRYIPFKSCAYRLLVLDVGRIVPGMLNNWRHRAEDEIGRPCRFFLHLATFHLDVSKVFFELTWERSSLLHHRALVLDNHLFGASGRWCQRAVTQRQIQSA